MKNFLILEAEAMKFVEERHRPQKYGDYPYFFHLFQVSSVARGFNLSEEVVLACWLHDILEDTATSYNDVKKVFGVDVADMVYLVTDEKGKNRREKHERTYPKIAASENATAVKLCDRIANVSFGIATNSDKMNMYVKEHAAFKAVLYNRNHSMEILEMWEELEMLNDEASVLIESKVRNC